MHNTTNDELFKFSTLMMICAATPVIVCAVAALFVVTHRTHGPRLTEIVQTVGNETDVIESGLTIMDCARRIPELRNSGLKVECRGMQ